MAGALGLRPEQVLVASTGVIGRPYPMDRVRAGLAALAAAVHRQRDALAVARAIMTTDTVPKVARRPAAGGAPSSASPRASA